MIRKVLITGFLFVAGIAQAQLGESAFHLNWVTLKPAYTDFVGATSSRGMKVGFIKFINERFGGGLDVGYSILNDYVPRTTYEYPGGAITTDIHNYMYYYTLALNGQYYFKDTGLLIPYAALGLGATFTEYTIFYNVYSDADNVTSFLIRPEAGAYYRFHKYSGVGLKAALAYDFAGNKSDYFELKNFSGITFQVGLVLFNR